MEPRRIRRVLLAMSLLGGALALAAAATGGLRDAIRVGLVTGAAVFAASVGWSMLAPGRDTDPGRRWFLGAVAGLGLGVAVGGAAVGRLLKRVLLPDPRPVMEAMASDLGGGYMELVRRAFHLGRSGDLQLLLAPFSSSNYAPESRNLLVRDPRTSHASVWMYLERVPLVVHAPGSVRPSQQMDRVTLADLAPTTAHLIGFDGWPAERDGRVLPGIDRSGDPLRVVVTYVIDGGGWNVLDRWPDAWPNLRRMMGAGVNYRNAIMGSFPAVTACAHATIGTGAFPRTHGITGHNIRTPEGVRKAYGEKGRADASDILVPTLADLWSDATGNAAWVGEIGYQIWQLGMLGHGGPSRDPAERPVAVFWDEKGTETWQPQNPDRYRLPAEVPGLDRLAALQGAFAGFEPSPYDRWQKGPCCTPPIITYQGDLIEATISSEPVGAGDAASLLYINYKAPDYVGHVYGMQDPREAAALVEVDAQLGRLERQLEDRFGPGGYALIVTADHGQCPLPDDAGGTRVDPIQLQAEIERAFHSQSYSLVESVVPSEIYLNARALEDLGITSEDVAAHLRDYTYRDNIGPYVPPAAIERDLLGQREFAAVFSTAFLQTLEGRDLTGYGDTVYQTTDPGLPQFS